MRDAFPRDQHIEDGMLLDVLDSLLVGDHGEIVPIHLKDGHPRSRTPFRRHQQNNEQLQSI